MNGRGGVTSTKGTPMTTQGSTTTAATASSPADRVRQLRERLGYTQEIFSTKCGERYWFIPKIENGKNMATSTRAILGLAKGAGVTVIAMLDYMRGVLSLDEMLPAKGGAP
jgi:hypothetical protein